MIKYVMLVCFFVGVNLSILAQDTSESRSSSKNGNNTQIQGNTQNGDNTLSQGNTQSQRNNQNSGNAQAGNNNSQDQQYQAFNSVCPVDGQKVDPSVKPIRYKGKEYGFDSPSCAVVFSDNPDLYAGNLTNGGQNYTHHDLEPENRKGIENQATEDNEEK
jgi:YHS domain-containing protein